MDPITTAILAVLQVIGSEVIKSSVKDAYDGLKAVIRGKGRNRPDKQSDRCARGEPEIQGTSGRAGREGRCRQG